MSGAGEFDTDILGPEEHIRCLREKKDKEKIQAAAKSCFWVVEKRYGENWAPLWLDMQCTEEGAKSLVKGRKIIFPKENLRVTPYRPG